MMTQVFTGPPSITNPLIDQVVTVNKRVTLNCEASGSGTIIYQWQESDNGSWLNISNNKNSQYTTDTLTESSQFRCIVSNEAGSTISTATISVLGKSISIKIMVTHLHTYVYHLVMCICIS